DSGGPDRHANEQQPDQSELDGVDGHRGGDGVPGGAPRGGGVRELRAGGGADRDAARAERWRQWAEPGDELQLSGAGDRPRGEPERVFQRRVGRDGGGTGPDAADAADGADADRGEQHADQPELDGVDGHRGGDGVPGGAPRGGGVRELRAGGGADRDAARAERWRQWAEPGDELQLSGAGDRPRGEPERVFQRRVGRDGGGTGPDAADAADGADADRGEQHADQPELDGVDGHRGGDGVPGGALRRGGVRELRAGGGADRDAARAERWRQWAEPGDELQLSGAGDRPRGEPERVFQRRVGRDGGGTGPDAADAADGADADRGEQHADQPELDGVDGHRGGDGVPGGALRRGGVRELRAGGGADRDAARAERWRQWAEPGDELQLSGAGDRPRGEPERVFRGGQRHDVEPAPTGHRPGRGVRVQRGLGPDGHRRVGEQQHGDDQRGDVDDGGAVRRRAGVRRDEYQRDGGERGVAEADDGDDAGGVGVPDGGADGVAGGDRQERGWVLPDGVVGPGQPAGGGGGVAAGGTDHGWADGAGAEHVDTPGGDVRRGD